ncbi:MAG: hypothetical protein QNJ04_00810 [Desulfobacterales bacterium]|nr:hypothetical protein [Desulfobacterales bacterium]
MEEKVIRLEKEVVVDQEALGRLLMLVPARHRKDARLIRFLAFRLKIDGFEKSSAFVSRKLMEAERCTFRGLLYDFLKDNEESNACKDQPPS